MLIGREKEQQRLLQAVGEEDSMFVAVYGNANGYYWSSSLINAQSAYAVDFSSNSFGAAATHGRCEGLSVRLVYPIE